MVLVLLETVECIHRIFAKKSQCLMGKPIFCLLKEDCLIVLCTQNNSLSIVFLWKHAGIFIWSNPMS